MRKLWVTVIAAMVSVTSLLAETKHVKVFVALCDNASQGIAPVPAKIGDGNIPAANLYWGCSDGLAAYFKASRSWKAPVSEKSDDPRILERLVFAHKTLDCTLTAEAWRGSEITACLQAFEQSLISGKHQLVVFIGHNVLMDRAIEPPKTPASIPCDAMVLCCKSDAYFRDRLQKLQVRPILLTQQFMYPGSFLVHDAITPWYQKKDKTVIRQAAANAYARNQKISQKAALGVFADLSKPRPE